MIRLILDFISGSFLGNWLKPSTPLAQADTAIGITALDIKAIDDVFSSKGWDKTQHDYEETYNSFLSMMALLRENEKELIIKLAQSFNKYDEKDYGTFTYECFSKIPPKKIGKYKRVVFLPIKDPSKRTSYKSSDRVLISLKYSVCSYINSLEGKDIYYPNSMKEFLSNVNDGKILIDKDTVVIGVDDYIGSGRTVDNFCRWLMDKTNLRKNQIMIVSIVCMEEALRTLKKEGFTIFCRFKEKKGISKNNDIPSKKKAFSILKDVTSYIQIDIDKYYKGYGESEALVSMINTPNNTFAVFWATKMKSGDPWPAPFKRVV